MRRLGLVPGARVGVIALNSDRYLELYLGLPAAGYVQVPVNSRLAPAEMRAILDDAGVSVVFANAVYPGAAGAGRVLTMPGDYEDLLAAADEVAVFGVPDPRWGETVYAVVFGRMKVAPDELTAHCREQIAGFKVPRRIELRTEPLPKSAAGKILKRELREPHWAGQHAQVSGG